MKSAAWLIGKVLLALVVVGVATGKIHARLTGTNPGTDVFCVGPDALEICVDGSGNIIPTTTAIGSLGTSALKFKNLFLSGNASIAGTAAITGAITATGGIISAGPTQLPVLTTTQLQLRSDPIGTVYLAQERVAGALVSNAYNTCVSTHASVNGYVYLSVSTNTPVVVVGAACSN